MTKIQCSIEDNLLAATIATKLCDQFDKYDIIQMISFMRLLISNLDYHLASDNNPNNKPKTK